MVRSEFLRFHKGTFSLFSSPDYAIAPTISPPRLHHQWIDSFVFGSLFPVCCGSLLSMPPANMVVICEAQVTDAGDRGDDGSPAVPLLVFAVISVRRGLLGNLTVSLLNYAERPSCTCSMKLLRGWNFLRRYREAVCPTRSDSRATPCVPWLLFSSLCFASLPRGFTPPAPSAIYLKRFDRSGT